MNQLIRGYVREDEQQDGEGEETESIAGKSDAGAGAERSDTGSTDMNVLLREAAFESRGLGA